MTMPSDLKEKKMEAFREELPRLLHNWYLEACERPESGLDFNLAAQESYEDLKETQRFLDKYIASKILDTIFSEALDDAYEAGHKDTEQQFSTISGGWKSGYERGALDMKRKCLEAIGKKMYIPVSGGTYEAKEWWKGRKDGIHAPKVPKDFEATDEIRRAIEAIKPTEV